MTCYGCGYISDLRSIWEGFDFTYIISILISLVPALLCITLHELAHGFVAYKLGDNTAKSRGRLTLNPIKHLDVMGLLMMLIFHVGWAKPVPVNMHNFRNPKRGMALTALAGPLSNLLIAFAFMLLYGLLYIPLGKSLVGAYVLMALELTAELSIGLAVFNLISFPPLDGSKVLFSLMSDEKYYKLMCYERYAALVLFALMYFDVLDRPIALARYGIMQFLTPVAQAACDTVFNLFYK